MKNSFYEIAQIFQHFDRKISGMRILEPELEERVYEDLGTQLCREYDLSDEVTYSEFLSEIHEFIDCYTVPRLLREEVIAVRRKYEEN